ncbi:PDZ and LIM domain protein 2 isoform X1 [Cygnus atratus]|uniref:PDZ and LIM domain protein 2 isoform X1 n=1 Tax=Cygnus atratus TaxID=8868 RepID=UPI0015D6517D|nr:PDZ and LIM domain protein 2 isoform X1 [Cygnus atratus]
MPVTVTLAGPAPWGFRITGGRDFGKPITVSKVMEQGKAAAGDLRPGDVIVSINGESAAEMLNVEAQNKIKQSPGQLRLQVERLLLPSPSHTNGDSSPDRLAARFQDTVRMREEGSWRPPPFAPRPVSPLSPSPRLADGRGELGLGGHGSQPLPSAPEELPRPGLPQEPGSLSHRNSSPGPLLPPSPQPPSPPNLWETGREQRPSSPSPGPRNRYGAGFFWPGWRQESPQPTRRGFNLPRGALQRVNAPARQVGVWEVFRAGWGRCGQRVQRGRFGCPEPPRPFPAVPFPQPGPRAGHAALGGGLGGVQDAAGEPGAAGGPAAIQHLPPAAGGSGGRGRSRPRSPLPQPALAQRPQAGGRRPEAAHVREVRQQHRDASGEDPGGSLPAPGLLRLLRLRPQPEDAGTLLGGRRDVLREARPPALPGHPGGAQRPPCTHPILSPRCHPRPLPPRGAEGTRGTPVAPLLWWGGGTWGAMARLGVR